MEYESKIDQERQVQAREYARLRHRVYVLELAVLGVGLVFALVTGLSVWLRNVVLSLTPDPFLSTLLYTVIGAAAYLLLFAPISFYSGYVLPHRYDTSNQNFSSWLLDMVKAGALTLAQDEQSSVVYGMPKSAVDLGAVDEIASLSDMGRAIVRHF